MGNGQGRNGAVRWRGLATMRSQREPSTGNNNVYLLLLMSAVLIGGVAMPPAASAGPIVADENSCPEDYYPWKRLPDGTIECAQACTGPLPGAVGGRTGPGGTGPGGPGAPRSCQTSADCPDDGNACNGTEQCNTGTGACESVNPIACQPDPDDGCATRCAASTGACEKVDSNCPGSCEADADCHEAPDNLCTTDTCASPPGDCSHTPITCSDDDNGCARACAPATGACYQVDSNCPASPALCGNGVVDPGEECEPGDWASCGHKIIYCTKACRWPDQCPGGCCDVVTACSETVMGEGSRTCVHVTCTYTNSDPECCCAPAGVPIELINQDCPARGRVSGSSSLCPGCFTTSGDMTCDPSAGIGSWFPGGITCTETCSDPCHCGDGELDPGEECDGKPGCTSCQCALTCAPSTNCQAADGEGCDWQTQGPMEAEADDKGNCLCQCKYGDCDEA